MPEVPKKITVDMAAKKLLIDGVEFPWRITSDGPAVSGLGPDSFPMVTITIPAEDVEIIPAGG